MTASISFAFPLFLVTYRATCGYFCSKLIPDMIPNSTSSGSLGLAALYQKLAWNYFTQTLVDSKKDYFLAAVMSEY